MDDPETLVLLDAAAQQAARDHLPYYGAVGPRQAYALLSAIPGSRLVDVRTRAEWDYVGRVAGSGMIEWQRYPAMDPNPQFVAELRALVPDPSTPVIFMCRSGVRSHAAAAAAAAAGYSRSFNMVEGFEGPRDPAGHRNTIAGWRAAGLPWVQS